MKKRILPLLVVLFSFSAAFAEEGSPLLSVDDLLSLEESYEAFLEQLGDLAVARGLLSEDERGAWHDAQMGDFFQNGGYGSILANYMPGALSYSREEDTLLTLRVMLDGGTLELMTMRRYTPKDSSLSGLMLTPAMKDDAGTPLDVHYSFTATSGVFMKWDALLGTYISVGTTAESDGETVVWSDQTPAADAQNPVLSITVTDGQNALGAAFLTLTVEGDGYRVNNDALQ